MQYAAIPCLFAMGNTIGGERHAADPRPHPGPARPAGSRCSSAGRCPSSSTASSCSLFALALGGLMLARRRCRSPACRWSGRHRRGRAFSCTGLGLLAAGAGAAGARDRPCCPTSSSGVLHHLLRGQRRRSTDLPDMGGDRGAAGCRSPTPSRQPGRWSPGRPGRTSRGWSAKEAADRLGLLSHRHRAAGLLRAREPPHAPRSSGSSDAGRRRPSGLRLAAGALRAGRRTRRPSRPPSPPAAGPVAAPGR